MWSHVVTVTQSCDLNPKIVSWIKPWNSSSLIIINNIVHFEFYILSSTAKQSLIMLM